MITPDTIIEDNLDDDISKILTEMSQIHTWNGTKADLRDELVKLLKSVQSGFKAKLHSNQTLPIQACSNL